MPNKIPDLISVIIPALNAERYLREAIDSVLAQDWPALEVLVVDNNSTDETSSIANSFGPPVVCMKSEPPGQPATMNMGLRNAHGEWLAFIDADDIWVQTKLKSQMKAFQDQPELDAVFGHAMNFMGSTPTDRTGTEMPAPFHGTLLIRRNAFDRVGDFDERYTIGSVMDWYFRAQDAGLCMRTLPDVFLHRRIHQDNLGIRSKNMQSDYARVIKAALDRRRNR